MSAQQGLVLIAALGGVAVSLQAQFMGLIDKRVGTLESVFITYGIGGLLIALWMLLQRQHNLAAAWGALPWYAWSSGAFGLMIVATIGYSTPRLGLVTALAVIVGAQFATGAIIDHFGLFGADVRPLDLARIAGLALILLGVWLTFR
jgi:transporter family-2 protein